MRTAVERSVRLLSSDEQCLHAAMSAVSGPMTVGLAAALIEERPAEVDDLVAGLVHRSLLVADGALRPGRPSRFAQLAIVRGHGAHTLDDDGHGADRRPSGRGSSSTRSSPGPASACPATSGSRTRSTTTYLRSARPCTGP